jgi:glutamate-1-semialdehyde 2,1-aminomutase
VSNKEWFERAQAVIPGGVDSPVRSFSSVGGTPYTVVSGSGAYVTDVEGNTYIDYVQSYGASILGHAHPDVVRALQIGATKGTTFGAPTQEEVILAEKIVGRIDGLEQIRFVSSGTEAVMSAVRLARGYTKRSKILKFDGCYHGHSDGLLVAGGSGVAEMGIAGSAGVTEGAIADTMVAPYNVVPQLDESVACVLVEPVAANMNIVAPSEGFLKGLRAECDRVGALLIFDEVITGFRLSHGSAQEFFGVTPDIWCFGKIIGGGLPVGAFGASKEILSVLAPNGPVYQAGTLSGNPLAMSAGATVLDLVSASDIASLSKTVVAFAADLNAAITAGGLFAQTPVQGPLMGLYVSKTAFDAPKNIAQANVICGNGLYGRFFHEMLTRGVAMAPGAYEIMFVSLAHSSEDLSRTCEIAREAASAVATA